MMAQQLLFGISFLEPPGSHTCFVMKAEPNFPIHSPLAGRSHDPGHTVGHEETMRFIAFNKLSMEVVCQVCQVVARPDHKVNPKWHNIAPATEEIQ